MPHFCGQELLNIIALVVVVRVYIWPAIVGAIVARRGKR